MTDGFSRAASAQRRIAGASHIYRRMLAALKHGHGVRLSADDVETLYWSDDAVFTTICNIERDDAAKKNGLSKIGDR